MAKVRLALYLGEQQHKLGPGKVALLEAIRDEGSISAAARSLGMAYRHAWVLVDELNRCFDEPVVETAVGGRAGGGAALTAWGEDLIRRFHAIERAGLDAVARDVAELETRVGRRRARRSRGD